jgi:hypothetical protein
MFLQLHDGPEMPYGLKKYPFPKYTGKLMPVSTAENPYAPGAPVMKLSPYAVLNWLRSCPGVCGFCQT